MLAICSCTWCWKCLCIRSES